MPGMIRGETPSLSPSSSLSASTQSFWSRSNLSPHHSTLSSVNGPLPTQHLWLQELRSEERGLYLIQLLLACANAVANNNMEYTNVFLEQLTLLASLTGDPMQRVATYFMEGLATRITKSWPGVYRALNSTQLPSIMDMLSARQVFFSVCPYLKFSFLTVNQAILDAMEGEKVVHLIDLEASDPVQWLALLQALSVRPGGPPHLRITGVSERRAVLEQTGQRLSQEAEKLDIPFQFHPVHAQLENLDVELLRVKTGEAVAISSVMRLHPLLAKDHRFGGAVIDRVLHMLRCLSPKVMVVVEQESNHNGPTLLERFIEALHYYCAMFDSLDSTMPQQCLERVTLEKHLFGQEIKNIVACEGVERVERHEKLEKWRKRMENAGFEALPLSYPAIVQAERLLHSYACDGYRLLENDGCLTLCWKDTPLYSASSWHA
ncbi:unnamed protein product [Sphagnum jensenii]|uniref:Scarecrow-like protein 3 n=2 Tax=Sphagnum jensenii TaxID=128206 RepID=A0ABP1A1F7_9BRYO